MVTRYMTLAAGSSGLVIASKEHGGAGRLNRTSVSIYYGPSQGLPVCQCRVDPTRLPVPQTATTVFSQDSAMLPFRCPPSAGNNHRRDTGMVRRREVFREGDRSARRSHRPKPFQALIQRSQRLTCKLRNHLGVIRHAFLLCATKQVVRSLARSTPAPVEQ